MLRLSCVVHGPICGRFMGFYVNGFPLTSASPYWVLNFQDGVALLFLVLSHGSAPFRDVTGAVFRAFWYFLYLLIINDSEILKKNREEDLQQTQSDRPIFKEKVGNYSAWTNVSFLISSCSNKPKWLLVFW